MWPPSRRGGACGHQVKKKDGRPLAILRDLRNVAPSDISQTPNWNATCVSTNCSLSGKLPWARTFTVADIHLASAGPTQTAKDWCEGSRSISLLRRHFRQAHVVGRPGWLCYTRPSTASTSTGAGAASVSREPCIMTPDAPTELRNARQQIISRLPKGGVGAEIGVWKGEFSARLLAGAQPKTLYLIDPWIIRDDPLHRKAWYGSERKIDIEDIYQGVLQQFASERDKGSVVVKRGFSQDILAEFPDGFFDYIYIDGDHEYSAVRKDCFLAFDKVRSGGYICGDDYSIRGWWKDGVVRAFHELIAEKAVIIRYVKGSQIIIEKLG